MINAVMMGLNPAVARERFDEIIAFGELEGFVDQKLKNYSSGMQVRLAFSVMVHTDPDVMLIDEVLAVGDAAFQQKCIDVFYRLRSRGQDDRAGDPRDGPGRAVLPPGDDDQRTATSPRSASRARCRRAYLTENFRTAHSDCRRGAQPGEAVRLARRLGHRRGRASARTRSRYGDTMRLLRRDRGAGAGRPSPGSPMWVTNEDGVRVFSVGARENGEALGDLAAGERIQFVVEADNRLSAGRYYVGCTLVQGSAGLDVLFHNERVADLVSYGAELHGLVGIDYEGYVTRNRRSRSSEPRRDAAPPALDVGPELRSRTSMAPRRSAAAGGASCASPG